LSKLAKQKRCFWGDEPLVWTPELINRLKNVDNNISRAVDYWLDSILGGYITDFVVETLKSYIVAEREFFKGTQVSI